MYNNLIYKQLINDKKRDNIQYYSKGGIGILGPFFFLFLSIVIIIIIIIKGLCILKTIDTYIVCLPYFHYHILRLSIVVHVQYV